MTPHVMSTIDTSFKIKYAMKKFTVLKTRTDKKRAPQVKSYFENAYKNDSLFIYSSIIICSYSFFDT